MSITKSGSSVALINHFENYLDRLDISLARFPSHQKYAMRLEINNKAIDVWRHLFEANQYNKREIKIKSMEKAILDLDMLLGLLRLAHKRGFLGYIIPKDLAKKDQNLLSKPSRELTEKEKMDKDKIWKKNAFNEYMTVSKMFVEIKTEIRDWIKDYTTKNIQNPLLKENI